MSPDHSLPDLGPDCRDCAALCCMGPALDTGADFAIDKPALTPCPNLDHHACGIHENLVSKGFSGCVRYSCLGAGQRVTQDLFGGRSWRDDPSLAAPMADALRRLRRVHAALELLATAETLPLAEPEEIRRQELIDELSVDFTPKSLADPALSQILDRVPAFLRTLAPKT